jgi:small subunit ribosomal protein S5
VVLRPAPPGTGIIANKTVRAVLECAGVKNAVIKSLGAKSEANVAKATLQALMNLHLAEHIYKDRGLKTPKPKVPIVLKFLDLNNVPNPNQSN